MTNDPLEEISVYTPQPGPLEITPLLHRHASYSWNPPKRLPYQTSQHALENTISEHEKETLVLYCCQPVNTIIACSTLSPATHITSCDLQDLLSHGKPTVDDIMALFLETLAYQHDIPFLCPQFIPLLCSERWPHVKNFFAMQSTSRSIHRPQLSGEQAIAIPCFVNNNHWVPVVRREINGQTIFLYSDDLNDADTECSIQSLMSTQTVSEFYPPMSQWIHCKSITYIPHSNECGPRILLALAIMSLHPHPHADILLPWMHPNLSEIVRTWVANTILTQTLRLIVTNDSPSLNAVPHQSRQRSIPCKIVHWLSTPTESKSSTQSDASTDLLNLNPFPQRIRRSTKKKPKVRARKSTKLTLKHFISPTIQAPHISQTKITGYFQPTAIAKPTAYQPPLPSQTSIHSSVASSSQPKRSVPTGVRHSQTQGKTKRMSFPRLNTNRITLEEIHPSCPSEQCWVHSLDSIDSTETFRVLLQNPNGLKLQSSYEDFVLGMRICHSMGAGVVSVTETNVNWNLPYQVKRVSTVVREIWETTTIQTSQHPEIFCTQNQRGGTLQLLTDRWVSRLQSKGVDPYSLGRWSYMTLRGQKNKVVTIITA